MIFSSILDIMNQTKEAQKKGLTPPMYRISQEEVIHDYNTMIYLYNTTLKTNHVPTLKAFKEEVSAFYLVVKDIYLDLESEEMASIYHHTREVRDSLIFRINTLENQSSQ